MANTPCHTVWLCLTKGDNLTKTAYLTGAFADKQVARVPQDPSIYRTVITQVSLAPAALTETTARSKAWLDEHGHVRVIEDNCVQIKASKAVEEELGLRPQLIPYKDSSLATANGTRHVVSQKSQTHLCVRHNIGVVAGHLSAANACLAAPAQGVAPTHCTHCARPPVLDSALPLLSWAERIGACDGKLGVPQHWPHSRVAGVHNRELAGGLQACAAGCA